MTISEMAMNMWPCWLMGFWMMFIVWKSEYKSMLFVDFSAIASFLKFMVIVVGLRYLSFNFLYSKYSIDSLRVAADYIPWQTCFGVFWEDMVFYVPLLLMAKMFDKEKWYKFLAMPLMIINMIAFGSGHMYQGAIVPIFLAFYIPWAMDRASKYGVGTMMICHILYDLITILSFRWMIGA